MNIPRLILANVTISGEIYVTIQSLRLPLVGLVIMVIALVQLTLSQNGWAISASLFKKENIH
jgi:hypothetical protein